MVGPGPGPSGGGDSARELRLVVLLPFKFELFKELALALDDCSVSSFTIPATYPSVFASPFSSIDIRFIPASVLDPVPLPLVVLELFELVEFSFASWNSEPELTCCRLYC